MRASLLAVATCLLHASTASAQEHFGFGALAGPGTPGAIVSARASLPLIPRLGLDLDLGRVGGSTEQSKRMIAAQARWLRKPRGENRGSDYFIVGAMHRKESIRTEFRFPGETVVRVERVTGTTPLLGYGWDWLSRRGARIGIELTTGGSDAVGPRVFAKVFAVWGPAAPTR